MVSRLLTLLRRGGFTPTDVPQSEANALIHLYNATDGANWTDNTGWLSDPVVGDWYGVTVAGGHVTEIDLNTNGLNGEFTAAILTPLTGLTYLRGNSNASLDCSFDLSDLPSGMTYLNIGNTQSTATGALSDLPSGMVTLSINSTLSTITGALSDLPVGMQLLYASASAASFTGGASVGAAGIRQIIINSTGMNEAAVDDILEHLYTYRASYTYATHSVNVGGTNTAPTGTYQDGDPPTTGLEYVYEIANDPEGEGFETWTVTWNGGTAP